MIVNKKPIDIFVFYLWLNTKETLVEYATASQHLPIALVTRQ